MNIHSKSSMAKLVQFRPNKNFLPILQHVASIVWYQWVIQFPKRRGNKGIFNATLFLRGNLLSNTGCRFMDAPFRPNRITTPICTANPPYIAHLKSERCIEVCVVSRDRMFDFKQLPIQTLMKIHNFFRSPWKFSENNFSMLFHQGRLDWNCP